jgi:hypothetical protein
MQRHFDPIKTSAQNNIIGQRRRYINIYAVCLF